MRSRSVRRSLLVVAAVGALVACGRPAAREKPARPVRVEAARREATASGLRYSATIQPYEQISRAFKVGGYVHEVLQRPGPDGRLRDLQQGDEVTAGMVLARISVVGTLASAGTVAFVLADLTRVKAVFGVPDSLVPRVKPGAALSVTSDAFANVEFPGRITAVSPSADAQSRVFSVEVTIPNPGRRLKAGMVATVEVPAPTGPEIPAGQPTVSLGAIVKSARTGGGYAGFVAEGPDQRTVARARDASL